MTSAPTASSQRGGSQARAWSNHPLPLHRHHCDARNYASLDCLPIRERDGLESRHCPRTHLCVCDHVDGKHQFRVVTSMVTHCRKASSTQLQLTNLNLIVRAINSPASVSVETTRTYVTTLALQLKATRGQSQNQLEVIKLGGLDAGGTLGTLGAPQG